MWAAFHGKREIFDYLISQGADIRATTNIRLAHHGSGDKAFNVFTAAVLGYLKRVEEDPDTDLDTDFLESLLRVGFDVNHQLGVGMTILHEAAEAGNPRLLDFLLNHGANPMIRNKNNETPFEYVCRVDNRNVEAARLLIAHMDVNVAINDRGETPLMVILRASEEGGDDDDDKSMEIVHLLLNRGDIDFSIQDNEGNTAMDIAEGYSSQAIQNLLSTFTI
jgi:ankyrin repeat protein